jgi:two-component system chemotaxis response regulator CheY
MSKVVLFVDDSLTQRQVMCDVIREAGYEVLEAEDGLQALEVLAKAEGKVNLIVSDVNMPNMGGLEFVQAYKQNDAWKHIPVIMLTTESGDSMKQQGLAIGVRAWATKPCAPEKLLKAVSKMLAD